MNSDEHSARNRGVSTVRESGTSINSSPGRQMLAGSQLIGKKERRQFLGRRVGTQMVGRGSGGPARKKTDAYADYEAERGRIPPRSENSDEGKAAAKSRYGGKDPDTVNGKKRSRFNSRKWAGRRKERENPALREGLDTWTGTRSRAQNGKDSGCSTPGQLSRKRRPEKKPRLAGKGGFGHRTQHFFGNCARHRRLRKKKGRATRTRLG